MKTPRAEQASRHPRCPSAAVRMSQQKKLRPTKKIELWDAHPTALTGVFLQGIPEGSNFFPQL
jgi:hypothetical protein